jgi:uncharacterized protein (TIRG00374 family)
MVAEVRFPMKKAALTALQITVTFVILWFVFRDPARRVEMWNAVRNAHVGWLFAGLGIYGLLELLAGIRWQILLRVQGIFIGWIRLLTLMMIGMFFNFFVPGGTGGDVVKVFYLLKETPGKGAQAFLSVVVDRLLGLVAVVLLAGVVVLLRWRWITATPETAQYVWLALAILGSAVFGLAVSLIVTGCGLVHKLPERLPGRAKLAEFALAYNLYGREWKVTTLAILLSALSHIGYFATFYCAARAFGGPGIQLPSFADLCAIMPIVNTIVSMPISLGGVGVREGLFQVFLSNLSGVGEGVAVVISSTGYLLTLVWGLVGGVLYLFYRPSEHSKLHAMQEEVADLEQEVVAEEVALEAAQEQKR